MHLLSTLGQDVRYALRQLRVAPTFSSLAVLTFALSIGGVTAMATVLNAVVWRPLPFEQPERLVLVAERSNNQTGARQLLPYPSVRDVEDRARGIGEAAAFTPVGTYNLLWQRPSGQERVAGAFVSPNFFSVLGAPASVGRTFAAMDVTPAAVLSHRFWRTHFNGDTNVVGTSMSFPVSYTIVGVMPPEFRLDEDVDVWLPYDARTFAEWGPARRAFHVVIRLQPGVDQDTLRNRLLADSRTPFVVSDLREALIGDLRPRLLLLFAAVCAVVVLGCVNIATLILDRSVGREREIAVRMALGASQWRISSQLIMESLVLASVGGGLGFMLAAQSIDLLRSIDVALIPRLAEVRVDTSLLILTVASTAACGVLAGLVPTRRMGRSRIGHSMNAQQTTERKEVRRLRRAFAVTQVGLAFGLLMTAGLIVRSLANVLAVDLGFQPEGLLTVQLSSEIEDTEHRLAFYEDLLSQVRSLPGVSGVGVSTRVPLREGGAARLEFDGRAGDAATAEVEVRRASRDYFRTMGIRLVGGRWFTRDDRLGSPGVAVVNETAARQFWPGATPLGHRVRLPRPGQDPPWLTVVGIVSDVRHFGRESDPKPEAYLCFEQGPPFGPLLVVRASGDPSGLSTQIRKLVRSRDPNGMSFGTTTMESLLAAQLAPRRYATSALAAFGGLALILTFVGVYATVSHVMAGRRREMAVRMTIGATPREILRLALADAFWYALPGLVLGAAIGVAASRLLNRLLFGIGGLDLVTLAAVAVGVSAVVTLASLVPAVRAARLDAATVLRTE